MEQNLKKQENLNLNQNQKEDNNSIWWKSGSILSFNKTLNFVVGNRGGGKTIESMRLITSSFLKNGKSAIWLRRYDVELDGTFFSKFFEDPSFTTQFPDYTFSTRKQKYGGEGFISLKGTDVKEPYIQFMCLSTALKHKSVPFPNVRYIIFDEFIIDKKSNMHYLKNEVFVFLELLQSVMRLREDVRVIFLGNSISQINPYFMTYNIRRIAENDKEFILGKEYVVQYFKNACYTKKLKESRFGRLVEGTVYGNYAVENQFFRDDKNFIAEKPPTAHYWFGLKYDDKYVSVWQDGITSLYYIHYSIDKNGTIFALTTDDHSIDTIMVNKVNKFFPIRALLEMYERGRVRYENLQVKSIFYDILYLLNY